MCQWRWRLLKKQHLEMAGFEQTRKNYKCKRNENNVCNDYYDLCFLLYSYSWHVKHICKEL